MPPAPRFTPSLLDGPTLEQLFVVREELLDQTVAKVADAGQTGRLAHTLLTGPRGAGKTHLIALVHHRATQLAGFGEQFNLAWLDEDPYSVVDYDSFLAAIAANMTPTVEPTGSPPPVTVVLTENFDRILEKLGKIGQQQLRARVERSGDLLLIATSTRVTGHMIEQARPFYGFFEMVELAPFSLDQAIIMLQRIAALDGNTALVNRLGEPDIQGRMAAIEQLAGGQPRMWATLSAGLTIERFDDLVGLLEERFDELTPYYQQQLDRLTPAEMKVVLALIGADRAMTVKEIAEITGSDARSVAGTLGRLKPQWVAPRQGPLHQFTDQRLTYYQLAEPLARVALQIKQAKSKPIQTVVAFLTAWFNRETLERVQRNVMSFRSVPEPDPLLSFDRADAASVSALGRLALGGGAAFPPHQMGYLDQALVKSAQPEARIREDLLVGGPMLTRVAHYPTRADAAVEAECSRIDRALADLQHQQSGAEVLALPVGIAGLIESRIDTESVGLTRLRVALLAVRSGGGPDWLVRALDAVTAVGPGEARTSQLMLACLRLLLGESVAGLETIDQVLEGAGDLTNAEWNLIGTTVDCETHASSLSTAIDLLCRVAPHLADADLPELIRLSLSGTYDCPQRQTLIDALTSRMSKGSVLTAKSIDQFLAVVTQAEDPDDPRWIGVRTAVADWRMELDDDQTAVQELDVLVAAAAKLADDRTRLETRLTRAVAMLNLGHAGSILTDLMNLISDASLALGLDDPLVLYARRVLARAYRQSGRHDEALDQVRGLVQDAISHFGADHSLSLEFRETLAICLGQGGHLAEAIVEYESILAALLKSDMTDSIFAFWVQDWYTTHLFELDAARGLEASWNLFEMAVRLFGGGHHETGRVQREVGSALREVRKLANDEAWAATLPIRAGLFVEKWKAQRSQWCQFATDGTTLNEPGRTKRPVETVLGLDTPTPIPLDDEFFRVAGLSGLPQPTKAGFLHYASAEWAERVGEAVAENMSDGLLAEFGAFVDGNRDAMDAWLADHVPNYQQNEFFRVAVAANPDASQDAIMREYVAMKWIELNSPDYRTSVKRVLQEIKEEIREGAAAILDFENQFHLAPSPDTVKHKHLSPSNKVD